MNKEGEMLYQENTKKKFMKTSMRRLGLGAASLAVIGGFAAEHSESYEIPHTEQRSVTRVIFRAPESTLRKTITKKELSEL